MIYFDTAYILKCYVKEHGWEKVRALACEHDRIACSIYGRLELHAALHRKLREGELSGLQLDIVRRQLSVDESVRVWQWIPLSAITMGAVVDTFGGSLRGRVSQNRRCRAPGVGTGVRLRCRVQQRPTSARSGAARGSDGP